MSGVSPRSNPAGVAFERVSAPGGGGRSAADGVATRRPRRIGAERSGAQVRTLLDAAVATDDQSRTLRCGASARIADRMWPHRAVLAAVATAVVGLAVGIRVMERSAD